LLANLEGHIDQAERHGFRTCVDIDDAKQLPKGHRSTVMLEDHFVNEKGQKLMSFMLEGDDSGMIYSGPARYVKVKEEGDAAAFFFPPVSTTLFQ